MNTLAHEIELVTKKLKKGGLYETTTGAIVAINSFGTFMAVCRDNPEKPAVIGLDTLVARASMRDFDDVQLTDKLMRLGA